MPLKLSYTLLEPSLIFFNLIFFYYFIFNSENVDGEVSEIAGEPIRKEDGYFGNFRTGFTLEKVNFPENSLFYVNQGYVTIQKSKKIFYADYHVIGQIIESSDPPVEIKNYECKDREVKYLRPKYDHGTVNFLGIYETIGFLVLRGDPFEVFLNYGYDLEKS